ncbi:CMD domain protein [Galbitalea sp. SE-J8]|uniref:CMD domain protein n=1 Tax=Galbitalea sp. SE-J8 TaxID=3054952 RepID=UPI00259D2570|nr:CMD domain protein [Galbitalea sp. SE-J8]MDM4763625.1 CMD domain protein [Galbitalea sp. SE-J8]
MSDLIDDLAGIAPGSPLDVLRSRRPTARRDVQASYDALIADPRDLGRASAAERIAVAYWVAALSGAARLAEHYRGLLAGLDPDVLAAIDAALPAATTTGPVGSYPPGPLSVEDEAAPEWSAPAGIAAAGGPRLAAALEHAHLVTYRPRDASPDALQALLDAGWTTDGIVTLSQLIAFVHFQLRLVAGFTVLAAHAEED